MTVKTSIPHISYSQLPASEYSQRTLGVNNGYIIETDQIKLVPLLLERDVPLLWEVYKDHPNLFDWMPQGPLHSYEKFYAVQAGFSAAPNFFNWICYVSAKSTKDASNDDKKWVLCGSVCLLDISLAHRHFEVGCIWFHPSFHGTFVMLETTYALLRFSFERLQAGRVQWKTHHKNIPSQKAAIKLGFDFDGIHRKHIIHSDGTWRNTFFYSMTDDDWFEREVTTDARPNLDVEEAVRALLLTSGSRGRQSKLEELIVKRKNEGKQLPIATEKGDQLN
ncbi:hypothetical protein BGZ46_009548 [Entomortierella lignicola]|nr:hypothetical protein BGZ46_009548 [Entomortierella lignicola]